MSVPPGTRCQGAQPKPRGRWSSAASTAMAWVEVGWPPQVGRPCPRRPGVAQPEHPPQPTRAVVPSSFLVNCPEGANQVVSGAGVLSKTVPVVSELERPHSVHSIRPRAAGMPRGARRLASRICLAGRRHSIRVGGRDRVREAIEEVPPRARLPDASPGTRLVSDATSTAGVCWSQVEAPLRPISGTAPRRRATVALRRRSPARPAARAVGRGPRPTLSQQLLKAARLMAPA